MPEFVLPEARREEVMTEKRVERRTCERFVVPGAVVYWKKKHFVFSGEFTGEYYPVVDVSRGGLRFLYHEALEAGTAVELKIVIPGENDPLFFKGEVAWTSLNPGRSYKYQVGIQFAPFGERRGQNSRETLARIISFEERFKAT
jgi:PilZ domain